MKRYSLTIIALLALSSWSFANSIEQPSLGFFAGIGVSDNPVNVDTHLSGTFDAVSGFPPLGVFTGAKSYEYRNNVMAPEAQLGYFHHLGCSDWVGGFKFLYQSLNANESRNNININFSGPITDQLAVRVKTHVTDEIAALALIGHSFSNKGYVYVGIGPSIFHVDNNISLDDTASALYFGSINNFSEKSNWIWGGMVQAGVTYYLNPVWFLDFNYAYAATGHTDSHHSGSFSPLNGGLNTGTVSFNSSRRVTAQSFLVSINRVIF